MAFFCINYEFYMVCIHLFTIKYTFNILLGGDKMAKRKDEASSNKEEVAKKLDKKRNRAEIAKKLNKEQKLFCYYYIVDDKSMKDAYKLAYPNCGSDAQASANASRLYAKPHIKEYCNMLLEDLSKSVELNAKTIVNGFMQIAFGLHSTDANKLKALENLAKMKGLFKEEKTVTHQVIKIDVVDDKEQLEEPNDNVVPSGCVILEDDEE